MSSNRGKWQNYRGTDPTPEGTTLQPTEPDAGAVLTAVFDLGRRDVQVFRALADHPGSTAKALAEAVDRHRSNVNRSLDRLQSTGLVERERRILESGGHVYAYYAAPPERAMDLLHDGIDEWATRAHGSIDALDL